MLAPAVPALVGAVLTTPLRRSAMEAGGRGHPRDGVGESEKAATRFDDPRDVIVIGAGPAGAMAARELARRGRDVLLLERREWPRQKVCGGCLSGATLELLARSGLERLAVELGAVPVRRLRLAGWGRSIDLELPAGVAVSRRALDAALVRAAVSSGVSFSPRTTARIGSLEADGAFRLVEVQRGDATCHARARVVVVAAGLGGVLPARLDGAREDGTRDDGAGSDGRPEPPEMPCTAGSRVGLGAELEAVPRSYREHTIHMAVGDDGYVGGVRLENGRWNLAAALDPAALRDHGPAALVGRILEAAGFERPPGLDGATWTGTPGLTRRGMPAARRLLAVGDAAGYVEPFTGEGILWALRGSLLAAPLAHRGVETWSEELETRWRETYDRRIRRDQRWCRRLAWLLAGSTRARLAMRLVSRVPGLAAPLVRELAPAPTPAGGIP